MRERFLILCLVLVQVLSQTSLQIQSVSTRIDNPQSNQGGSLKGGTILYIKALGLDPTASNNFVRIGNNENIGCIISDDGVFGMNLACRTVADLNSDLVDQQVYLTVRGFPEATCVNCKHSFLASRTPVLQNIIPKSVQSNEITQWQGSFVVNNFDEIQDQLIGGLRCSRSEIVINDPTVRISTPYVNCQVSAVQPAGYNDVILRADSGYASQIQSLKQFSIINYDLNGDPIRYQVLSLATITSVGTSDCSIMGKVIEISGVGFSSNNTKVYVAGTEAKILQASLTSIRAEVPAFDPSYNASIVSGSYQYAGGAGLRYTKYDMSINFAGSCDEFRRRIIADSQAYPILDDRVKGEPSAPNIGSYYGEYYRGYFRAPATGNHTFYLAADDCAQIWMNLVPGSTNTTNVTKIAALSCCSSEKQYFNFQTRYPNQNPNQRSAEIYMNAGDQYYIEFYYVQAGGTGFFSAALQVPSPILRGDSLKEILAINITYSPDYEIFQYNLYSTNEDTTLGGSYVLNFRAVDPITRVVLYNSSSGYLSITAKNNEIEQKLRQNCGIYASVGSIKVDSTGTPLQDQTSTSFAGYQYTVTVTTLREQNVRVLPTIETSSIIGSAQASVSNIQDPSPVISGTFSLNYGDQVVTVNSTITEIPIETSLNSIVSGISSVVGSQVSYWQIGNCVNDGCMVYLQFQQPGGLPSDFTVSASSLSGGKTGTNPQITVLTYIAGSTNAFLDPIPAEVFFTAHDTPQVQVVTNGLYSVCQEPTCNIQVSSAQTPTLDAYTYTSSSGVLQLTVTDPRVNKFTQNEVTVQFADQQCQSVTKVDNQTITCSVNKDLQAGSWLPIIHFNSIGYVKASESLVATQQIITITSVDPVSDSSYGGSIMTVIGTGFPYDLSSLSKFIIQIGNQSVPASNVQSVNSTQIKFKIPAQGIGATLSISTGQISANNTDFSYSDLKNIVIKAITPSSSSPVKKVPIKIEGSNFGSDKQTLQVYLIGNRTYELNVLNVTQGSSPNPDVIWAYLGGGQSGTYQLSVSRTGYGQSQPMTVGANTFAYAVKVNSISPSAGSTSGGTVLTITGENFIPGSNQVYIGNAVNWVCNIISESSTEIKCITPPKYLSSEYDGVVNVTVTSNIVDESQCFGNCGFTYDDAKTPTQTLPSDVVKQSAGTSRRILLPHHQQPHRRFLWDRDVHNDNHPKFFIGQPNRRRLVNILPLEESSPLNYKIYSTGDVVTINGTLFGDNPQVIVGFYGLVTTFTSKANTSLTFTFPSLPAGTHTLQVAHETYGFANGSWNAIVRLNLSSVSPTTGSKGGQLLTILGGGFNTQQNIDDAKKTGETRSFPTVSVGGLPCKNVKVVTSEKLTCISPSSAQEGDQAIIISQTNSQTLIQDTASGVSFRTSAELTPTISGVVVSPDSVDATKLTITVTGTSLDGTADPIVTLVNTGENITGAVNTRTSTSLELTFINVPGGSYQLQVAYTKNEGDISYAFFQSSNKATVTQPSITFTMSTTPQSSIFGGAKVIIQGTGFSTVGINNQPYVCGQACPVKSSTNTQIICNAPALRTGKTLSTYLFSEASAINLNDYKITYDQPNKGNPMTDGDLSTYYYSNNNNCFFQVDFGDQVRLRLAQLNFLPQVTMTASQLVDGTFTYSTDGITFNTILTIGGSVHAGWNYNAFDDAQEIDNIRYLRFNGVTSSSKCRLSELQVKGWVLFRDDLDLTSGSCPITLQVNNLTGTGTGQVIYTESMTPNVTSLSPAYGKFPGGDSLTINGEGFGNNAQVVSVKVSGVPCVVSTCNDTQIVCTTGDLDQFQQDNGIVSSENEFVVTIDDQIAQLKTTGFFYANSWSDDAIWGGDIPPRDGDVVVVPKGQTLMVDIAQSPKLYSVLVEGTLLFKDNMDIDFYSSQILIMQGKLQIGTYSQPRQSKLTITLSGSATDLQLPDFGNKFIGCHMCTLDIHGKKRSKTWTLLAQTGEKGDSVIQLIEEVDWVEGEQIVIASTNWDHSQSEVFTIISATTAQGKTSLTLNDTLTYRHYSAIEVYGAEEFPMQAEVGLLSRNILIQGDPADSITSQYGAHLMIHGANGAIGRISYTEFTNVGQPTINGRYPIHFNLNGPMIDSFVEGNAIHNSYARIITIHGTHNLRVFNNLGYNCLGHAIYLEDGIEQFNDIHDNLMLGTQSAWQMQQSDITSANYWITNPLNYVYNNRAGGSQWYGFSYQIYDRPEGVSSTYDICPTGLPIGSFVNNTAHSNGRFGLKIRKIATVQFPCQSYRTNTLDPFASNPSIQSVFENFTTFANHESGILGEQLGNVKFNNIKTADNKRAGFDSYLTNLTKEGGYVVNSLIVGKSQGNWYDQEYAFYQQSSGLITPRTSGFNVSNIRFWNFFAGMNLLQANSQGDNYIVVVSSSKTTFFDNIMVANSSDYQWIRWNGLKRNIFYDVDGTLTNLTGGGYLIPYKVHLDGVSGCRSLSSDPQWGYTLVCDRNSTIRDILINNPQPTKNFISLDTMIHRLTSFDENISLALNTTFQKEQWSYIRISNDVANSVGIPFAGGYYYNIHWQNGIDFSNVGLQGSEFFSPSDPGVVLRFNYSASRELFDVTRLAAGTVYNYSLSDSKLDYVPDPSNCRQGDNFHDNTTKFVYLCISGKNKSTPWEYINLNPVTCRFNCPIVPKDQKDVQKRTVSWSDPTIWPSGKVPDGTEKVVVIPADLSITLDVSPPLINQLIVDGEVNFQPINSNPQYQQGFLNNYDYELVLRVKTMWIRYGTINIGTATTPYVGLAAIELNGAKNDQTLLIDQFIEASNKVLAVTGSLNIYAPTPGSVWTRLAAFANAGDRQIEVLNTDGWNVGDQIAIAPSGMIPQQHEIKIITAIQNNVVTLDSPLSFNHYGAPTLTIDQAGIGQLDMRTPVAHLTRNVQIRGNSAGNWGGRLLVYQFSDDEDTYKGTVNLYGAEFINMGQPDTYNAGLDFRYTNNQTLRKTSSVVGCSFHDSPGMHFNAQFSYDLFINQNVFYNGVRFSVRMVSGVNNTFTNNLIINNQLRKISSDYAVAAIFVPENGDYDYSITNINISHNLVAGSEGTGYYLVGAQCDKEQQAGMFSNTASSCASVGIAFRTASQQCTIVFDHGAYHSGRGLMLVENSIHIYARNLIAVENQIGLVMQGGSRENYNNTYQATNIYISALARPDCPLCYRSSLGSPCANQLGMLISTLQTVAFSPYQYRFGGFEVITTTQKLGVDSYLTNIIFENYRLNYDRTDTTFKQCSNNIVFTPNGGASDSSFAHYMKNVTCPGCDIDSKFKFIDPPTRQIGWFGGCGSFVCTGLLNILMSDIDGSFLGSSGVAIPNNSWYAGNVSSCQKVEAWNGYLCSNKTGILSFLSISPDAASRLYSPVTLTDGIFYNQINSFKEWSWEGPEPKNTRESKFISIVSLNTTINMTNAGQNPSDSQYFLSRKGSIRGAPEDWVIIKLQYQTPHTLEVLVGKYGFEKSVASYVGEQVVNLSQYTNQCGANNYFSDNRTIHFVVNGEPNCMVRIRQQNAVQITMRLQMDYDQFFSSSSNLNQFNKIYFAFLSKAGIDTSKVKTVGYARGSVIRVDALLAGDATDSNSTSQLAKLDSVAQQLQAEMKKPGGQFSKLDYQLGVTSITQTQPLNLSQIPSTEPTNGTSYPIIILNNTNSSISSNASYSLSNNSMDQAEVIGIVFGVIFGVFFLLALIGAITYLNRSSTKVQVLYENPINLNHTEKSPTPINGSDAEVLQQTRFND